MAERNAATKGVKKSAKSNTPTGLTAEERAALRETIAERKAAGSKAEQAAAVLEKIAAMAPSDRALAKRIHAIVKANAPDLSPKLWYGMPAYAKDGKIVCFFQDAQKFKTRYATLGFSDEANLDEGAMWPTAFALKELTAAEEARIGAIVKKAAS
ncbi:MAG: hypothetical protein QOH08_296 [Chloroflexota bacterium]|jgi:uncharacterized protein YdhG (YjbR/CyaY superfamily)|nr:hypothetical protein [Chloroflexota bacterium]